MGEALGARLRCPFLAANLLREHRESSPCTLKTGFRAQGLRGDGIPKAFLDPNWYPVRAKWIWETKIYKVVEGFGYGCGDGFRYGEQLELRSSLWRRWVYRNAKRVPICFAFMRLKKIKLFLFIFWICTWSHNCHYF